MSRFSEIQAALDARLAGLSGLPPVAWENVNYEPTEGDAWIRPTNLPSGAQSVGIATGQSIRTRGFYQIDIFTPAGNGPGAALTLADQIADHFSYGLRLTRGGSVAVLGTPVQDPASASGAWFRVAVIVPYDVLS